MKYAAIVGLCLFASSAVAQCAWSDDGALATEISNSQWELHASSSFRLDGGSFSIDRAAVTRQLFVGALLRDVVVDDTPATLTLANTQLPQDFPFVVGRNTFTVGRPDAAARPCFEAGLSMLDINGATTLDEQRAVLRLQLWPVSQDIFTGLLQIGRTDAGNRRQIQIEVVEARRLP